MPSIGEIGATRRIGSTVGFRLPEAERRDAGTAIPPHRALVPLTTASEPPLAGPPTPRPQAAFLTHLIATAQRVPQTRERRRADPNWVNSAYAAAMRPPAAAAAVVAEIH